MKFAVLADDERWEALKSASPEAEWQRADDICGLLNAAADACFNLREDSRTKDYSKLACPVFINSVITPLSEINSPGNTVRINGWPGFIQKEIWEIGGKLSSDAVSILKQLGKKYIVVNDEPGFVSARILAMIINEAFFAKGDNVSTEEDIDLAMKLGTNYPYGPFEWGRLINLKNIYELLAKLTETDLRYIPAPALKEAAIHL